MATWKELGEVPDSDDESILDNEESQSELPQNRVIKEPIEGIHSPHDERNTNSEDVWDIPFSSQSSKHNAPASQSSSHDPPTVSKSPQASPDSSPLSPVPQELAEDRNGEFEVVSRIEDRGSPSVGGEVDDVRSSRECTPEKVAEETSRTVIDLEEVMAIVEEEESTRPGRSLRPRKPIQEHPYLVEGARFSKLFKSHGVRPIRVAIEEAVRRRKEEEDSQEKDYEDNSQLTVRDEAAGGTQESQASQQQQDLSDDNDELALASQDRRRRRRRGGHISPQDDLRSSQDNDDGDLPSLDEIFQKGPQMRTKTYAKRRGSPRSSSKRKVPKFHESVPIAEPTSPKNRSVDVLDIPPSPPQTSPALASVTPAVGIARPRSTGTSLTPKASSVVTSRDQTPAPVLHDQDAIDLTGLDGLNSSARAENTAGTGIDKIIDIENDSSSTSERPVDVVRQAGPRLRHVLPASYLRLDREVARSPIPKPTQRQSLERSPERSHRKGVAQRLQVSPNRSSNNQFFLDGDSGDESDDEVTILRIDDIHNRPYSLNMPVFEDDVASVVEEDHIDRMLPVRKRGSLDVGGDQRPKKRAKSQKTFKGQQSKGKHQQKITGLMSRSQSATKSHGIQTGLPRHKSGTKRHGADGRKAVLRPSTAPRLSILDVVESNAPQFIRIAARAASRRPDKGKSSPSKKRISLGTRKDNIDVFSVLRDWKDGKIRSQVSSSVPKSQQKPSVSMPRTVPISRFARSRKLAKQTSMNDFVAIQQGNRETFPMDSSKPDTLLRTSSFLMQQLPRRQPRAKSASLRPAQLEAAGEQRITRHEFHAQKKALDALYRKSRKTLAAPANVRLERLLGSGMSAATAPSLSEITSPSGEPSIAADNMNNFRRRQRKRFQPRHVDTSAPQYAHANDPLPREASPVVESVMVPESNLKLMGLGPFGTHYTHHFEIFPLDSSVFFHESTIIGDRRLAKALEGSHFDELSRSRGHCILTLGERTLEWDAWDAQTSSELGVLLDWILERVQPADTSSESGSLTPTQAADFVLDYAQSFISLPELESGTHFAKRILEIVPSFIGRLVSLASTPGTNTRQAIDIFTRFIIIVLQSLRICEKLRLSESLQTEDLLKMTCQQATQRLLNTGLGDVRRLYDDLQIPSFRKRGIRNDQPSAICWVVLIRTLQEARIPRAGFWDIVSSVMWTPEVVSTTDAHILERLWHNMFTLLPLGEFDNLGVAVPGLRHTIPLEGWVLPQKLLIRVFELYKSNQRQAPGFNEYFRSFVGRCHYLVEQWGWRKGSVIIGTIFDFFASQNLSHLRNEEAYSSPQFLEDLANSPSLEILPEDRCFHVFLKLLALIVKRFRKLGLLKDIKNLVARVLPNHNHQYLNEYHVHEHQLAALRNHHDLLCTLFWSAPAGLRPAISNIEQLVLPGSSHKEACLIHLRAWNQLARFIVSAGGDRAAYKPFMDWQVNVFKQVLNLFLATEADIEQQFVRLSKDSPNGVNAEMKRRVITVNKQATADVLHFSLKANLDVMRHAPSLGTASFVINTYQLQQVFIKFKNSQPEFDWETLRAAVDVVGAYLTRIENFFGHGITNPNAVDSWHGDDAVHLLERHILKDFFPVARNFMSEAVKPKLPSLSCVGISCMEQTTMVASRLAARLLHAKATRLSNFFASGHYWLFEPLSEKMSLHSRQYLCLFAATLIEQGITDFSDVRTTPLGVFLCAVVKPYQALAFESRLAAALKRRGEHCLKDAPVASNKSPDYNSNRDLFDHTVSSMRKTLNTATSNHKNQLTSEYSDALRLSMNQMKNDLKSVTGGSKEQAEYIQFVRSIVSLIKTNDIYPVDKFFYEFSEVYSPPAEDPSLRSATLLSYGLKLEGGSTSPISGLFYHLWYGFKLALANGKLRDECAILVKGMKNTNVFSFMLGRMFPAILKTMITVPETWVLMNVYVESVELLLTEPCVHRDIGEETMNDLLTLFKYVSSAIQHLRELQAGAFQPGHLYTVTKMTELLNLLAPSLRAYLCMRSEKQLGRAISRAMDYFTDFTRTAAQYLPELWTSSNALSPEELFEGVLFHSFDTSLQRNEHIDAFAKEMMTDIPRIWVSNGSTITVTGPARPGNSSTQSGIGAFLPVMDMRMLAKDLYEQVNKWNFNHDYSIALAWRRRDVGAFGDLLF